MDIEPKIFQLSESLFSLALESPEIAATPTKSNTLTANKMPWDDHPKTIDQYNIQYLDRIKKLSKRVPLKNAKRIEQLVQTLGNISVIGMVKRLEIKRKRAFEKDYVQYYKNSERIYSEQDQLELEDATGKVKLRFGKNPICNNRVIKQIDLPYGIVVGFTGRFSEKENKFIVSSMTYPELPPQPTFTRISKSQGRKMLVMNEPSLEQIKVMFEELSIKQFSGIKTQIKIIIIIGYVDGFSCQQIEQVDQLYSEYSNDFDIFVMPGKSQFQLPQRAYHPLMYSQSKQKACFCSNPQQFTDQDTQFEMMVFDNRNLVNLKKNCAFSQNDIQLMQAIVHFSHFAPTAPFSLRCQIMPQDNLILNKLPHLMLATNSQFQVADLHSEGKEVRLVAMQKNKMIIIDQDTLEVTQFKFMKQQFNTMDIQK